MKKPVSILTQLVLMSLVTFLASCEDPVPSVVVTTNTVTEITKTSAQISGCLTSAENTIITELGLCWGISPNPEASDNHISTSNTTETLCHTLTQLQPETEYHVRTYAFDGSDYYYSNDVCFQTLPRGLFSVYKDSYFHIRVRFSKGNLQYQASTNTWRFAEHQWDFVGYSKPDQYGYTCGTVEGSSNHLIGPDYDGWIDLFGWGTSGQDHGAVCYQPWSTSTNAADYYAYGYANNNLYEMGGKADWGWNPISNGGGQGKQWRTLTDEEWRFLLRERTTASGLRYVDAVVHDIRGIILLPDDWDNSIVPLYYEPFSIINVVTDENWQLLEENGAVFLPPTGEREGTNVSGCHRYGLYWTSSRLLLIGESTDDRASNIQFSDGLYYAFSSTNKSYGLAVRLVKDY